MKNLNYLLPDTRKLLLNFMEKSDFLHKYVLVGGSALALHLQHRKSEDLDFFTYEDSFNKNEIFEYIKQFEFKEIINESNEQIDILINGVKITFFNAKWDFLKPLGIEKFNLSSIDALAAMKVNTLFLRAKFRDYYDLYFLVKEKMGIKKVFECSKNIMQGINFKLFCIALVYIDDIEDDNISHLDPKINIAKEEIREFFEEKINILIRAD
ncbi:hypothetical protein BuS5_02007 [Desulfosarcina sp. BuS5]|uniref:nucleotidyl transferase AbiEii/AbiGii toxin family protein n=1 Tax=Desulfosarcina sp. BuS5 TaxID=933262 RepID=UPI0004853C42|nr:nucleotidyl transferase AbiEii/AbiGii toxin family protein [Desulfosarcina sp. BuS5]WDN89039.1 hypothetical protein BuS5_02007 [Desulfosarcina sp. BuS5]